MIIHCHKTVTQYEVGLIIKYNGTRCQLLKTIKCVYGCKHSWQLLELDTGRIIKRCLVEFSLAKDTLGVLS